MATVDSKELVDRLIANNGYFEDDPRVYMIVEYINMAGRPAWGIVWENEPTFRRDRYLHETEFIRKPKVIWRQS